MPKKSVKLRNIKRVKLASSAAMREKRKKLLQAVNNPELSEKERLATLKSFKKLPRDASLSRRRNRCKLCGRPRSYNRLTGLCRLHMRIATINGMVPGMHKSSW